MSSTAKNCGAIIFIIFSIVGVVGNFITAIALLRDRKIRQHSTTTFILSLCISDLIFSSFNMPVTAATYSNEDLMNHKALCKMFATTFYVNFCITTFSIAGIAINRYILIVHHHLYKRFYRMSLVLCQLSIIWLVPVAPLIIPLMDQWGTIGKRKIFCRVIDKDGKSIEDLLYLVGVLAPCLIISVLYACIYYKVRQLSKIVSKNGSSGLSVQAKERERHLTMMTFLILISLLVCCLPAVIEHFWFLNSKSVWFDMITTVFCCLLCIVNPFIYAATNRKYRAAYSKLFSDMNFCRSKNNMQTTSE